MNVAAKINNLTETAQEAYAMFANGDIPALLELVADNVEWQVIGPSRCPHFGTFRGKNGVREFFAKLSGVAEILKFEPQTFAETERQVFVTGVEGGVMRRSGLKYEAAWCHIFTIDNGLITNFVEYINSAPIVAAYDG